MCVCVEEARRGAGSIRSSRLVVDDKVGGRMLVCDLAVWTGITMPRWKLSVSGRCCVMVEERMADAWCWGLAIGVGAGMAAIDSMSWVRPGKEDVGRGMLMACEGALEAPLCPCSADDERLSLALVGYGAGEAAIRTAWDLTEGVGPPMTEGARWSAVEERACVGMDVGICVGACFFEPWIHGVGPCKKSKLVRGNDTEGVSTGLCMFICAVFPRDDDAI